MFWCLWKWKYPQVRMSMSNRKCHASSSPLTNKQNRVVNYNIMSYSTTQNNARVSEHTQILLACTLPFNPVKKIGAQRPKQIQAPTQWHPIYFRNPLMRFLLKRAFDDKFCGSGASRFYYGTQFNISTKAEAAPISSQEYPKLCHQSTNTKYKSTNTKYQSTNRI